MQTQTYRKPNRLDNYNYSWDGYYYITICTQNKQKFFGEIQNEKMILNQCGEIAKKCWLEIPKHFPYCQLDEFIIMPNHIHAVLIIEGYDDSVEKSIFPDNPNFVVNANLHSLQYDRTKMYLSRIVQGFKSSVTRILHREYGDYHFSWQKSFYDHVVRNEKALNNIRQYIIDNPMNWNKDEENNLHSENM